MHKKRNVELMTRDERYMSEAIEQARRAAAAGEIPVGAIVVRGDEIIARGRNKREADKSVLGHAELEALEKACRVSGDWRLEGCELFVTLEPCAMCAGAAVNARIKRIVFGAFDPAAGCCGSVCEINEMSFSNRPETLGGVLDADCKRLLSAFFDGLRDINIDIEQPL